MEIRVFGGGSTDQRLRLRFRLGTTNEVRRRHADHGEVFTGDEVVKVLSVVQVESAEDQEGVGFAANEVIESFAELVCELPKLVAGGRLELRHPGEVVLQIVPVQRDGESL